MLTPMLWPVQDWNVLPGDTDCATFRALFAAEWALLAADLGLNDNAPAAPDNKIPERWGLASILAVICIESHPHHDAALAAYAANLASLEAEAPGIVARIGSYKHALAAILMINQSRQDFFVGALGLENAYDVLHGGAKDPTEPFSDEGDLDGDGLTNYEEYRYAAAFAGTYEAYVECATDAEQGASVPLAVWPVALSLIVAGLAALRLRRNVRG